MNCYMLSYDLNGPGQKYKTLYAELNQMEDKIRIMDSMWLFISTRSIEQLTEAFAQILDNNDDFFIMKITKSTSGQSSTEVIEFLNKYREIL